MKKRNVKLVLSLLFLTFLNNSVKADDHSNARNMAMANSSIVSSYGIFAFGINPANYYSNKYSSIDNSKLHITKKQSYKPQIEFTVFSLGAVMGSDAKYDFFKKYVDLISMNSETFVRTFTSISELEDLSKNLLPDTKTNVDFDFQLKWLSFNITFPHFGALNFTVRDHVGLTTEVPGKGETLPPDYITYIDPKTGKGYLTDVQFRQSEAISSWLREYSLGFSKIIEFKNGPVKSIALGISGALVHGFGYVAAYRSQFSINTYGISYDQQQRVHIDSVRGSQNFNAQMSLTDYFNDFRNGTQTHFNLFPDPAGKGYSLDFGINIEINEKLRLGASVTELGKIKWDKNTFSNFDNNNFLYTNFFIDKNDPTYNNFVNDINGLNTRDTINPFETNLPTKFRAGIMYQPSDKVLFQFKWQKGNNNQPGNTTAHIFSLGSEYTPVGFLLLRTGVSIGGPGDYAIGLGAGLRFLNFTLDVGANGINQIIRGSRYSLAVSTSVKL